MGSWGHVEGVCLSSWSHVHHGRVSSGGDRGLNGPVESRWGAEELSCDQVPSLGKGVTQLEMG